MNHSAVLESMLTCPIPPSTGNPIPVFEADEKAQGLEVYLNHVHSALPPALCDIPIASLAELWHFADRWEDDTMLSVVVLEL